MLFLFLAFVVDECGPAASSFTWKKFIRAVTKKCSASKSPKSKVNYTIHCSLYFLPHQYVLLHICTLYYLQTPKGKNSSNSSKDDKKEADKSVTIEEVVFFLASFYL